MPAPLGCPADHYTVKLHHRGGEHPYTRVRTGVTEVQWSRELDAVSTAQVTIARRVIDAACDNELRRVRPWVHELTLYRAGDNQPVWMGPVTLTERTRETYVLQARDLAAWLEVRTNPHAFTSSGEDLSTMARWIVRAGLTERGNPDPNFWPYARFDYAGITSDREQERTYATLVADELDALTRQGLDYTVVRRMLWCFPEATMATPATGRLTHHDIVDDLSLVVDGDQAATRWIVEGSTDDGRVRAIEGGNSQYYGLIERQTRAAYAGTHQACANEAVNRLRYSQNPPQMVTVPDGATLHPRAPVTVDQLVPGTRWDVSLVDWIDDATTASRLARVSVTAQPGTREQIAVSLVPIGTTDQTLEMDGSR